MKPGIILNSKGPETAWNALRLGNEVIDNRSKRLIKDLHYDLIGGLNNEESVCVGGRGGGYHGGG